MIHTKISMTSDNDQVGGLIHTAREILKQFSTVFIFLPSFFP